jgi:hypothetical protein
VNETAICPWCKLSAKTVGEIKHVCAVCESTLSMGNQILKVLGSANSCCMNQRTIAKKLGHKAAELSRGLTHLSRLRLIERAFSNPNLEAPSAVTYRLTAAGRISQGVAA